MASEIVFLITEQRNKQRITLPAGSYRFGRSAQCEYVLRRNNVGEVQFVVACTKDGWTVTDSSTECATWYDNRYLNQGETCPLQEGDVLGLNTDGNASTQEITFRVEEIRTAQSGETGLRQEQTDNAVLREVDVRRKKRVLIGRGDDCDIKLVSDRVSRHHCEILYKDGHYELRDLGSTNGTYVDGARVTGTVLRSGAVINVPTQVFAFSGGDPNTLNAGPSLMFITIPKVFESMGMGTLIGILFFVLVLCAALTSSIALTESAVSTFQDELKWGRKKSTLVVGLIMLALGTLSSLGYGPLAGVTIIGMQFLDFFDFLTNSVMMPIAAIATCLLVSRVIGMKRIEEEVLHGESKFKRKRIFYFMIQYLCPIFAAIIFVSSVANAFGWISM